MSCFQFRIVVALLMVVIFTQCSPKEDSLNPMLFLLPAGSAAVAPDFSKMAPGCFRANPSTAVITRGTPDTSGAGFSADWNDPTVIKHGSEYWMYASSDNNFDINVKIYRLVSADGIGWQLNPTTPVLSADAGAGAWDHRSVETPSVVFFQGKYHLFYTGYPTDYTQTTTYRIGHATSTDGVTWTRDANNPIVSPTDPTNPDPAGTYPNYDFNQWLAAEPAAVVFDNKIYLYFSTLGANVSVGGTWQVIGLTTSSDGVAWTPPERALTPDTAIYPRSGGAVDWLGYSTPMATVLDGRMHLFFDVVQHSPWRQLRLHHAVSADGKTNWTQDSSAIYSSTDFAWTNEEIRSPSILLDGTALHLWFAGTETGGGSGTVLNVGHARCDL